MLVFSIPIFLHSSQYTNTVVEVVTFSHLYRKVGTLAQVLMMKLQKLVVATVFLLGRAYEYCHAFSFMTPGTSRSAIATVHQHRAKRTATITTTARKAAELHKQHFDTPVQNELLKSFEEDVTKVLKEIRAGKDESLYPPGFVSSKTKMTISHVWDLDMWKRHTSRTRLFRHLWFFSSRLSKRIFPQLAVVILWSGLYAGVIAKKIAVGKEYVPLTTLSLVSTFLGFLLTLRSNQGLSRLSEGRELWGRAFIVTRDTAHLLAAYVYPKDRNLGIKAARHLSIFPFLLKGRLRDTDDTDIIETMLYGDDYDYVKSQRKKPAANIARIRQVVANLSSRGNLLPIAAHQQIETNLNEMNYILGMCERLRGSPIPPVYTSHSSRLLAFYLFFLPIALHGAKLNTMVNILVTSTVGYAMLGLDEISHLLEQPFSLMPIHQLSKNMMLDVADSFVCQPPILSPKTELLTEEFLYPYDDEKKTQPSYW